MLTVTPQSRVADLVREVPGRSRVFARYGIDFCCGGHRPLAEACAEKGLDPREIIRSLAEAETPAAEPPLTRLGPGELIDHIVATHHHYLKEELPRLLALSRKVASVHGQGHPELFEVAQAVGALAEDMAAHLEKEEEDIFVRIRAMAGEGTRERLTELRAEHDVHGANLRTLRRLTGDYRPPAGACESYRALFAGLEQLETDTHLHVHKENYILFPMVTP